MDKKTAGQPVSCGVLFCGGCNPYFDRLALYHSLVDRLAGKILFSFYEEGEEYELILLINGCETECLMGRSYPCPLVVVKNGDVEQAVEKLTAAAGQLLMQK